MIPFRELSHFKGLDANPNCFFLPLLNPAKPVPPPWNKRPPEFVSKTIITRVLLFRKRMSPPAGIAIGGGGPSAPECVDTGHYAEAPGQGSSRDKNLACIGKSRSRGLGMSGTRGRARECRPSGQATLRSDAWHGRNMMVKAGPSP